MCFYQAMHSLESAKEALFQHLKTVIADKRVLEAFETVKREDFVPAAYRDSSYADTPLPLGKRQTISQPTTVLLMTQFLQVKAGQKILEIGTGSGYQAAILSHLVGPEGKVISMEIIESLYRSGKKHLLDYSNATVLHIDGSQGYPPAAPYDRILMTAASPTLPTHLLSQLTKDGLLLAPVGSYPQRMMRFDKAGNAEDLGGFLFVPLTGKYGFKKR